MPLTKNSLRPDPDGQAALDAHRDARKSAAKLSVNTDHRPAPEIASNGEEVHFEANPVSNFTKGLPHDRLGRVDPEAYCRFVNALHAINDPTECDGFPAPLGPSAHADHHYPNGFTPWDGNSIPVADQISDYHFDNVVGGAPTVRKWESPQAGHNTDLMGPSPAGVAMPPAPKLGSSELVAEMAEVYAMALLRDVPFSAIEDPTTVVHVGDGISFTIQDLLDQLNALPWFDPSGNPVSSATGQPGLNACEARRRAARFADGTGPLTARDLFRGSTSGAHAGPYLSQFMLVGGKDRPEGFVAFGTQDIDQRSRMMPAGIDFMTNWAEWLDVQNGARFTGPTTAGPQRFLTTPRDVASYVHIDQLYQAYFNAALILLDRGLSPDPGLPDTGKVSRVGFATWGGPHILSLFAEVATRGLKAVRRQKFQIHRRARPEVIGARLAVGTGTDAAAALGAANAKIQAMLGEFTTHAPDLLTWIAALNARNNAPGPIGRGLVPAGAAPVAPDIATNLLLPMAFPEGSPMHPAYGAGHATVAGACVTVIKAFFRMFNDDSSEVTLPQIGIGDVKVGAFNVLADVPGGGAPLTVQGELDKLAANISVGRNMAGVHYYTDYYESARMGERIAVGMLEEQMLTSPEPVSMSFNDFNGRRVSLSFTPGVDVKPVLAIDGIDADAWWIENLACYLPADCQGAHAPAASSKAGANGPKARAHSKAHAAE